MDIVERLREKIDEMDKDRFMKEVIYGANWRQICKENERLREDKAELVEALNIAADGFMDSGEEDLEDMCRAVIAKATGGDDV